MRKNLLPKIIIAVVLFLIAVHFFLSSVTITHEGSSWKDPKFSFSYTGPGASSDGSASTSDKGSPNDRPQSMWSSLWPSKTNTSHESSQAWQEIPDVDAPEPLFPELTASSAAASETSQTSLADLAQETTHASLVDLSHEASHTSIEELAEHSVTATAVSSPTASASHGASHDVHANHGNETKLPCAELEGAQDVVFIIKTGATEVDEKIPVHFNTTLRCFPNHLIYSDYGEEFEGHTIHDALGQIVDQIRLENDDFDLWRRLHNEGRSTLAPNELSINDHVDPNGGGGNPDNGGWRLDKFKNIPMVNYTIHRYPDAKWFIYTDADTYIVWSNLLKWVKKMDSKKLSYLGSPAMIDDQIFGHGGSGYIISNALMKKAADVYNDKQEEWDEYAAGHWAGDCVLATLLEKIDAPLTWSYPIIQGGDPVVMDFWETGYDRRLWCYPAVSYHHIKPATVASLWHLEQEWLANGTKRDMHHGDVYKQWFVPQLSPERQDWDNLADDEMTDYTIKDAWECRDHCQANSTCMQWSFKDDMCRTSDKTRLGSTSEGMQAGWMIDRIHEKIKELDECDEGEWIVPDHDHKKRSVSERHELALQAAWKYR